MRRLLIALGFIVTTAFPVAAQVVAQGAPAPTSDARAWPFKIVFGGVQVDPRDVTDNANRLLGKITFASPQPVYFDAPQHVVVDSGTIGALTDGSQKTQIVDGDGNVIASFVGIDGPRALDVNLRYVDGDLLPLNIAGAVTGPVTDVELRATPVPVDASGSTVPVSGTFWQATQPISAAALPLPALAATSTKQSDGSQKTQVVDGSGNVVGATANALDINIKSGNPTTITATQATGTNLHVVVDSAASTAVTNAGLTALTTSGGGGYVRQDSTATIAKESGGNLAAAATSVASIDTKTPALGQALAAASVPVVMTASQLATLTPLSTVAVTNASLDGTTLATLDADIKANVTLHAGTAVIGHVIADTGSTTAVTGSVAVTNAGLSNIDVASSTLATAARQDTGNTSLASIKTDVDKIPSQGQALAAASMPVVLTAAQVTTLTPPSSVTVTQATGTNLHTVCDSGCSGGTTDADDASIAAGQTTGLALSLGQAYDGSVWRRMTFGTAGTASAQVWTVQGVASMTPVQVSQATAASLNATVVGTGTFATQSAMTAASGSVSSGAFSSGSIASGAIASGAVASGAYASGSISDGAMVTLGAKADAKSTATDTTAVSIMSVLKEISAMEQAPASLAAGSALIGKVGIDQTTPGTTNRVDVGVFPDNEPFNVAQINGVTPLMGVGASGTGALRTASLIHDGTDTAQVTTTGGGSLQVECTAGCATSTVQNIVSIGFNESVAAPTAATWYIRRQWALPSGAHAIPTRAYAAVTTAASRTMIVILNNLGNLNVGTNTYTAANSVASPFFYGRLFGCVTTVLSATGDNLTPTYTDELGNSQATAATAFAASLPVGDCVEFPLAAGTPASALDTGVRAVTAAVDSAATTGVVTFYGVNTILDTVGPASTLDAVNMGLGELNANEQIAILEMQAATTAQQRSAGVTLSLR